MIHWSQPHNPPLLFLFCCSLPLFVIFRCEVCSPQSPKMLFTWLKYACTCSTGGKQVLTHLMIFWLIRKPKNQSRDRSEYMYYFILFYIGWYFYMLHLFFIFSVSHTNPVFSPFLDVTSVIWFLVSFYDLGVMPSVQMPSCPLAG